MQAGWATLQAASLCHLLPRCWTLVPPKYCHPHLLPHPPHPRPGLDTEGVYKAWTEMAEQMLPANVNAHLAMLRSRSNNCTCVQGTAEAGLSPMPHQHQQQQQRQHASQPYTACPADAASSRGLATGIPLRAAIGVPLTGRPAMQGTAAAAAMSPQALPHHQTRGSPGPSPAASAAMPSLLQLRGTARPVVAAAAAVPAVAVAVARRMRQRTEVVRVQVPDAAAALLGPARPLLKQQQQQLKLLHRASSSSDASDGSGSSPASGGHSRGVASSSGDEAARPIVSQTSRRVLCMAEVQAHFMLPFQSVCTRLGVSATKRVPPRQRRRSLAAPPGMLLGVHVGVQLHWRLLE